MAKLYQVITKYNRIGIREGFFSFSKTINHLLKGVYEFLKRDEGGIFFWNTVPDKL